MHNTIHALPASSPRLMTYREVADATVLSVRTIQRAVDAGQLAVIRFGHRTVRITEADVSKWVMTKRSGGTQ